MKQESANRKGFFEKDPINDDALKVWRDKLPKGTFVNTVYSLKIIVPGGMFKLYHPINKNGYFTLSALSGTFWKLPQPKIPFTHIDDVMNLIVSMCLDQLDDFHNKLIIYFAECDYTPSKNVGESANV